jgi:hypothetical protein
MIEMSQDSGRLIGLLSGRAAAAETFSEADWHRIVDLAQRQRVAPLLRGRLKERGLVPPAAAADRLRQLYLANVGRNTLLFHEAGNILRVLQAAGIPVIPLKGACLGESVYGDIGLRPMADIDLLVRTADLAEALNVLRTHGFASARDFDIESARQYSQHMPLLLNRRGVPLELHWTISDPLLSLPFGDDDLEQLWRRATPANTCGSPALMLSPADLLLHLCAHASVHHRFSSIGLGAFLDIELVVRRYGEDLDWEQFVRHANQWGIAKGVSLTLQLAQEWTAVVIPPHVMPSLECAAPDEATVEWVRHKIWNDTSPAVSTSVARMGKERVSGRLGAVYAALFPSRAAMALVYPVPATSWRILCYYPVRLKDLVARYGRVMWQLLRRDRELSEEMRQESRLREYLASKATPPPAA